ncbi:MAG: membrane protein insertase YidC [Planctomycetota bacterium]
MLLAVVLSFLVVSLYFSATGGCTPPKKGPEEATGTEPQIPPPAPGPGGTAQGPGAAGEAPAPGPPAPPAPAVPEDTVRDPQADYAPEAGAERTTRETPELWVTFRSRGGSLESVTLRHAFEADHTTPLDLIVPEGDDFPLGAIDDGRATPNATPNLGPIGYEPPGTAKRLDDAAGRLRRYFWSRDEAAEAKTPEDDVIYRCVTIQAIWTKQWILPSEAGRFDIRLRIWRQVTGEEAAQPVPLRVLVAAGLLREAPTGAAFQQPNASVARHGDMTDAVEEPNGLPVTKGIDASRLRMLGARTHYFLASFYARKGRPRAPKVSRYWATGEEADKREATEKYMIEWFRRARNRDAEEDAHLLERIRKGVEVLNHAWMVVQAPSGRTPEEAQAVAVEIPLYVGPISREVLRQDVYAVIEPVIAYRSAFDILADALLWIYDIFRNLFGNAGVGVILMTLVVRGLMMPLSIRNQLSMRTYSRKISKLKPKLEELKKKFGKNPKRMREAQTKLYREHGVGFPTGCLMMLVQVPIFFALFSSLRTEYTLRNAVFLWIQDLGSPDKLIDFGRVVFDIGILTLFSLNILPLLMVGLSLWQQHLMPKPADEQQAQQMRMMKWLPIVFAVILYNYTAALALYMVLSSAVSITESRIVKAKDAHATAAAGS